MKRFFIFVTLSVMMVRAFAQEKLYVCQKSGVQIVYEFEKRPLVYFDGDTALVVSDSQTDKYHLSTVKKFSFKDPTAVRKVASDKAKLLFKNNCFSISGMASGVVVTITDASGKVMKTAKTDSKGACMVSTEDLPKGVYVISAKSITHKFLKK